MSVNKPNTDANNSLLEKLSKVLGASALVLTMGCQDAPKDASVPEASASVPTSAPTSSTPITPISSTEFVTVPNPSASATASKKRTEVKGCLVKGNINHDGRKIYHVAGSCPDYDKTKISTKHGERCFGSEAEARAAGWQKAGSCK